MRIVPMSYIIAKQGQAVLHTRRMLHDISTARQNHSVLKLSVLDVSAKVSVHKTHNYQMQYPLSPCDP